MITERSVDSSLWLIWRSCTASWLYVQVWTLKKGHILSNHTCKKWQTECHIHGQYHHLSNNFDEVKVLHEKKGLETRSANLVQEIEIYCKILKVLTGRISVLKFNAYDAKFQVHISSRQATAFLCYLFFVIHLQGGVRSCSLGSKHPYRGKYICITEMGHQPFHAHLLFLLAWFDSHSKHL